MSTTITDEAAATGTNEFVLTLTAEIAGQELEHTEMLSLDLRPIVTTVSDDATEPEPGSLRALVANPRSEGHTITFHPDLAAGAQVVIELEDQLEIRQSLSVAGYANPDPRVRITRPAGAAPFRLLQVESADPADPLLEVELSRLEFVGGEAPAGESGGAVHSTAALRVIDSRFEENRAHHGGAVHVESGTFTAEDSIFLENRATVRGGAIYSVRAAAVTLLGSAFFGNQAENGGAAMIWLPPGATEPRADLRVERSTFVNNFATSGGGALYSNANATILETEIEENGAAHGGGVRNHYRMIIGQNSLVSSNRAERYAGILNDGIMEVRDSEVSSNSTVKDGDGGGIYNGYTGADARLDGTDVKRLLVVNSRIARNNAQGDGGGIYNVQLLEVVDSTFEGNMAQGINGGGAIYSSSVAGSEPDNRRGTVIVSGSTFSENTAAGGVGGAIAVDVPAGAPGAEFRMENSTVHGNEAFGEGGGIALTRLGGASDEAVEGRIAFSTVTENSTLHGNGGGIHLRYGSLNLRGSVIADNEALRDTANEYEFDLYSQADRITSEGYNWVTTTPQLTLSEHATDVVGQPTVLAALEAYGGPTLTRMPLADGLGGVPAEACLGQDGAALTTDQRGEPRPGPDGTCYRGAVEPLGHELP